MRDAVFHVLWARCDRYPDPQFIAAWSDDLVDAWHEWYLELRAEAIRGFRDFDDWPEPWTFWTTVEQLPRPTAVGEPVDIPEHADA